ncbi:MAG: autotransporter-associated beta strand repeat-containing protein [Tepidisphaeraceae bacterium]
MHVRNSIGQNTSTASRFSTAKKKSVVALAAAAGLGLLAGSRSAHADILLWTNGGADGAWNGTSADWNDLTTSTNGVAYTDGSAVQFSDSGPGGSIAIAAVTAAPPGVSPASVEFTHGTGAAGNYTFTDGTGTSGIEGAATVTLDSGYVGTVYLSGANTYTGGTFVNGGTLQGTASDVGTGNITLGGGTLQYAHSSSVVSNNIVATSTTNSTISAVGFNPTLNGTISSTGGATVSNTTLNLSGNGTITIGPASGTANTLAGFTGTVELNSLTAVVRFSPTTAATSLLGSSTALFDLGTGTATLQLQNTIGVGLLGALEGATTTTLGGNTHNSSVNYNQQVEFAVGGAGLSTTFNGLVSQGNQRENLVVNGGGSLTLSHANTYSSRQSTGSTPSGYQGPGTWVLGQGQAVPALTGLPATFTSMPVSSVGAMLFVSNTTGSGTGVSPVLVEGATTPAGSGATFGGDGIVSGFVTTFASDVGESNVSTYALTYAAGPVIDPTAAGANTSTLLTLTGGLRVGDYTNLDFVVGATPSSTNNTQISVTNTSDATLVTTALSMPTDGNIEVNFNVPGTVTPGSPYTLITYTGTDVGGGADLANWQATGVPAGASVVFNDTGTAITATFNVPEPTSIGLLALGAVGLLARRRERSAK